MNLRLYFKELLENIMFLLIIFIILIACYIIIKLLATNIKTIKNIPTILILLLKNNLEFSLFFIGLLLFLYIVYTSMYNRDLVSQQGCKIQKQHE
jgi:hypothetical protein